MNERLPYEEELKQQWNDLPLPDEDLAWADMKRRLGEDDEGRLLPFWLRGCAGWGLLGILLLGLGWWIIRPEKWFNNKKEREPVSIVEKKETYLNDTNTVLPDASVTTINKDDAVKRNSDAGSIRRKPNNVSTKGKETQPVTMTEKTTNKSEPGKKNENKTVRKKINRNRSARDMQDQTDSTDKKLTKPADDKKEELENKERKQTEPVITTGIPIPKTDSLISRAKTDSKQDTLQKTPADSSGKEIKKSPQELAEEPRKDSSNNRSFSFSGGIALHQQLPIDGQGFTPYNAVGRKSSLRDYIPSIYVRLNRDDKWFLQSGFRYGAPQLVKKYLYRSKTDTVPSQKFTTTSTYLEKTFYHQMPFTFNYFILPGWSLGGGVVWNKFSSAVSSRDVIQRDRFTGLDTAISIGTIIVSRQADTNFVKSYFQASMETQFKWKRFSFGANYSFGLEPYIRFTLNGEAREEKNSSLQLFIRYELWRSNKK